MDDKNKRKFARITSEIPVNLLEFGKGKKELGSAYDISLEGMGLSAKKDISLNIPLELQLKIPDGGKPIAVRGKIVWSKRVGANSYRFGVKLENVDYSCLSRALRLRLA